MKVPISGESSEFKLEDFSIYNDDTKKVIVALL